MLNCRKYLVKRQRLSVEVSVLVVARPVVCMCYYLDTYHYETGYESLVSSVKVGNELLFKKYSLLPIHFI